jgi:hypothetical protein
MPILQLFLVPDITHMKLEKSFVLTFKPACSEVAHAGRQLLSKINIVYKSLYFKAE